MRIDGHQHFWKYSSEEYGWIGAEMGVIKRDFLPGDLITELKEHRIDGTVVVQARQSEEETEWLLTLAKESSFILGVVGWVNLCSPDVGARLKEYAANPRFVGVRHVLQDEPDDLFMLRDDFQRGLTQLQEFKLTYDLLIHPRHLGVAARLVEQFPSQPFVLDHLAKPFIKDQMLEPWETDIRKLAEFPNVYCKISGMVTEADWERWKPESFIPYLDVVFSAFGDERIMMGSDWPVCLLAANSYGEVINVLTHYMRSADVHTVERVMGTNCSVFYGL